MSRFANAKMLTVFGCSDNVRFLITFFSYAIPLSVALISYLLRAIADMTCSNHSHVCRKSSDFFSHIYAVVVMFLMIVAATKAKQIKDLFQKLKAAFEVMNNGGAAAGDKKKKD